MREIIFWFNTHKMMNYWLNYAIDYFKHGLTGKYNQIESYIIYFNLKISFKVYEGEKSLTGHGDKNQYWVEDLFDNNFEEFFFTFIFENEPFKEGNNGKERNINIGPN